MEQIFYILTVGKFGRVRNNIKTNKKYQNVWLVPCLGLNPTPFTNFKQTLTNFSINHIDKHIISPRYYLSLQNAR